MLLQIALGIQCGHAARACAGDGLAVDEILHVASRKHSGHAGLRDQAVPSAPGDDVAV